jgi:hypothetical protein
MKVVLGFILGILLAASTAAEASVYAYIEQVAPYSSMTGQASVWEVYVPGYAPEQCTYSWSAHLPNGYDLILFHQKTWAASASFSEPGEHIISVNLRCKASSGVTESGLATLAVYVGGAGTPIYPPPPPSSSIRPTPESNTPPFYSPLCLIWVSYGFDEQRYFVHYNSACSGGERTVPLYRFEGG